MLFVGETGTGKELFARAVHDSSSRAEGPFIAVNCAAIPEGLVESELFGYEEGAFTGARRKGAPGKITQAHGGTLFLDEIGDMPIHLQARLLRILQERVVTPLGSTKLERSMSESFARLTDDCATSSNAELSARISTIGLTGSSSSYRRSGSAATFAFSLPAYSSRSPMADARWM